MGVSNLCHLNDITKKCALHLRCVTGNFTRFPCSEWMLTRTSRLIRRKTAKLSLPEENQMVKGRNCCKHYVRKAAEHSETWGEAYISLSHAHTPTQISQNALCVVRWHKQTSLHSSQFRLSP